MENLAAFCLNSRSLETSVVRLQEVVIAKSYSNLMALFSPPQIEALLRDARNGPSSPISSIHIRSFDKSRIQPLTDAWLHSVCCMQERWLHVCLTRAINVLVWSHISQRREGESVNVSERSESPFLSRIECLLKPAFVHFLPCLSLPQCRRVMHGTSFVWILQFQKSPLSRAVEMFLDALVFCYLKTFATECLE